MSPTIGPPAWSGRILTIPGETTAESEARGAHGHGKVSHYEPRSSRALRRRRAGGGPGSVWLSDACKMSFESDRSRSTSLAVQPGLGYPWGAGSGMLPGDRRRCRLLEGASRAPARNRARGGHRDRIQSNRGLGRTERARELPLQRRFSKQPPRIFRGGCSLSGAIFASRCAGRAAGRRLRISARRL